MKNSPLVSIAVLSYKNTEYLNECLASIFSQTYDNIELIISNDGSDDFDTSSISNNLNGMKRYNISNIIINKNKHNMGTVKHCNTVLDLSAGKYIMFIACDDAFNNEDVVKDMVDGFQRVPSDVMSIIGQTEMRNENLSVCLELYVNKITQKLINELPPQEFYRNHLVLSPLLPAASRIYKRECFEKYGRFDESYFLIEDWTIALSQAKQGMRTYYLDIIAVNHRSGGVSHSKLSKESFAHKMFALDMLRIMENTLLDYSISERVLSEISGTRIWWVQYFNEIWGKGEIPVEMLVSIRLGEYLANYWVTSAINRFLK